MSYVRGWHAWYADTTEYSSITHTQLQLPQTGLQIIMLYFNDMTRRILAGNDLYFWQDNGSPDGIWAQTDDSLTDVQVRYPNAHIITGQLIPDSQYAVISKTASRRKEP